MTFSTTLNQQVDSFVNEIRFFGWKWYIWQLKWRGTLSALPSRNMVMFSQWRICLLIISGWNVFVCQALAYDMILSNLSVVIVSCNLSNTYTPTKLFLLPWVRLAVAVTSVALCGLVIGHSLKALLLPTKNTWQLMESQTGSSQWVTYKPCDGVRCVTGE